MSAQAALASELRQLPSVAVALSGGVDSAVLLAGAMRYVPGAVVAVSASSDALPSQDRTDISKLVQHLGADHVWVDSTEVESEGYRANSGDRCYYCKVDVLSHVRSVASQRGIKHIALGTNLDDLQERHRPGLRAGVEAEALTPLADAQLTKDLIRQLAHDWELPVATKPGSPCLASRIAHNVAVTPPRLRRIDLAESLVRDRLSADGWSGVSFRVRDLGDERARVEVPDQVQQQWGTVPGELTTGLSQLGFQDIRLAEFRSGSLNDVLFPTIPIGAKRVP